MKQALLFDLDDTLMVDDAADAAAFEATAWAAAADVDAAELASAAHRRARELWRSGPAADYAERIEMFASEGLWCRFEGEPELREWAPTYRRETWRLALGDQGIDDPRLAEQLGERFWFERRARHQVFDDVEEALTVLGRTHVLGLVTNGASCLQREKVAASGLAGHFTAVVISGDLGIGKPEPAIFHRALSELGCSSGVMVGNSLERDVRGALAAGLDAVWINRSGQPRQRGVEQISTLAALTK